MLRLNDNLHVSVNAINCKYLNKRIFFREIKTSVYLRNHATFLREKKTITRRKTSCREGLLPYLFREISAVVRSLCVTFWLMSPEKRWHVGLVTPVIQGQHPSALGSSSVCAGFEDQQQLLPSLIGSAC